MTDEKNTKNNSKEKECPKDNGSQTSVEVAINAVKWDKNKSWTQLDKEIGPKCGSK